TPLCLRRQPGAAGVARGYGSNKRAVPASGFSRRLACRSGGLTRRSFKGFSGLFMSGPVASGGARITDRRQLVEYLASGSKPAAEWRIGTEHEKFVFRQDDLSRAPYAGPRGIEALLNGMTRFGWKPVTEGGKIIALSNDAN